MGSIMLIVGGSIAALVVWMIVRAVRLNLVTANVLRAKIEPALAPLREGRTPSIERLRSLAAAADTRSTLWRVLQDLKRPDLFPPQYATPEALAESDLVVWLLHGNELGAAPDGIELANTIERSDGPSGRRCRYFLFRFRTSPPHWAAPTGWMAGLAGPYSDRDEAFDAPAARVFSRFEAFDSRSPESHLAALTQT